MTIISPRQLLRRNKPSNPPVHRHNLADALASELERQAAADKTGTTRAKDIALRLINSQVDKQRLLKVLGGDCTDPQCSAAFHATLCHVAYS